MMDYVMRLGLRVFEHMEFTRELRIVIGCPEYRVLAHFIVKEMVSMGRT